MVKVVYVVGFVLVGLALWPAVIATACQIAILLGGRLGEEIRMGSPNVLFLWKYIIPGVLIGSVLNGILGSMAIGDPWSRPDYSFYLMVLAFMVGLPLIVMTFAFAHLASFTH